MRYVVLLEDEPSRADVRPRLMPEHQAFLQEHADIILEAGPLADPKGGPAGGIWIVEASNAESVQALVELDPFWAAGLRKSVRVLAWRRVFAAGKQLSDSLPPAAAAPQA